jgi:lipid-A-disaccharide synthase
LIGKILIKLPYIALPNIIAREEIVPELIGFQLTVKRLTGVALELLGEKGKSEKMRVRLERVAEKLGRPGAIDRAAKVVVEMVN